MNRLGKIYQIQPCIIEPIDGDSYLVVLENDGDMERNAIILSDLAEFILHTFEPPTTVKSVLDEILATYDTSHERAEQDLFDCIEKLEGCGLLNCVNA